MKYDEERVNKIVELIKADNYTILEICEKVNISETTFYEWKASKKEFSDIIKKARDTFNDKIIVAAEKSLSKKVAGYSFDETKTIYISNTEGDPIIKERTVTTKHYQPDTAAIIFTLCNRKPEDWINRQSTDINVKNPEGLKNKEDMLELMGKIQKGGQDSDLQK